MGKPFGGILSGVDLQLDNNANIKFKTAGGGNKNLINFSVSDVLVLGHSSYIVQLNGTSAKFNSTNIDLNNKEIKGWKDSAATSLSGTPRDIEISLLGTPYYFTVYPTKA